MDFLDCLGTDDAAPSELPDGSVRFGLSDDAIKAHLRRVKPDIVATSGMFTAQMENIIELAKLVKSIDPSLPFLVGGPHTSVEAQPFLKQVPEVDLAVGGEGEHTIIEIMQHFEGKKRLEDVDAVTFRRGKELVTNKPRAFIQNLDEIPIPAYHLIDMERYLTLHQRGVYGRDKTERRTIPMITSRGCPYDCCFCSIHLHMGKPFRAHSAEYVLDHIRHVTETYGVQGLQFEDDNLTLNRPRFEKILDGLIENNIKIRWNTPNGVRADTWTRKLVRKAKQAGCIGLTIGVESGVQRVLDEVVHKDLDLRDVVRMAKLCHEEGIPLQAFYIIGFPGETKEEMKQTLEFSFLLHKKYGVPAEGAMYATPLIGTPLHKIARDNGYLTDEVNAETLARATQVGGKGLIQTSEFTPEDVYEINKMAIRYNYRGFLLDPKRVAQSAYTFLFQRNLRSKMELLKRMAALAVAR